MWTVQKMIKVDRKDEGQRCGLHRRYKWTGKMKEEDMDCIEEDRSGEESDEEKQGEREGREYETKHEKG